MICPNCLKNDEIAYAAMSGSLVCLAPGCNWERPMTEDETYELFFGNRRQNVGHGHVREAEMLVHS